VLGGGLFILRMVTTIFVISRVPADLHTHTAHATAEEIAAKGWAVLPHPPYSPDLAPSDFFLFGPLKDFLRGQKFNDDDEVKAAVRSWVRQCKPDFFADGFAQWKTRWDKCVARGGDYIEK